MNVAPEIIIFVIAVEIFLVIAIILFSYLIKLISLVQIKKTKLQTKKIEEHLDYLLTHNKPFSASQFPGEGRKIEILLAIIEKFDQKHKEPAWYNIKNDLIKSILIPLARKYYKSRNWTRRLLAARAFTYQADKQDEPILINLIQDSKPLIYEYAILAAIKLDSEKVTNEVITKIANERRLAQTIALKFFEQADKNIKNYVYNRLSTDPNPYIRATCYKILLRLPSDKSIIALEKDIEADNLELSLSAIKYLAYSQQQEAISILMKLLVNPKWEIRSTASKLLGELGATQAVSQLEKCLHDSVWWVRINTAEALKNLGEKGLQVLKSQNLEIDKFAYETANYVLKTIDKN